MNGKSIWSEIAVPILLLVLFVLAFWGVLGVSRGLAKEPVINLSTSNQIVTEQKEVPITGKVENTTELKVAGSEAPIAEDGSFSVVVPVEVGENNIELVANDDNDSKVVVTVTREDVVPETTTTFTPNQTTTTTTTPTTSESLTNSGPVETLMGSLGLSSIMISLVIYRRSKLQKLFTKELNSHY